MDILVPISDKILSLFDTHLVIKLKEKSPELKFPYIFLRDHCRCTKCYNTKTYQLSLDILSIPVDIKPLECTIVKDCLKIIWEGDRHVSEFCLDWLETLRFPKVIKKQIALWDKCAINGAFDRLKIPLDEYLQSGGVKSLLEIIEKYGFAFVTEVESTIEATEVVAKQVGLVQKTLFGEMWTVSNDYFHADTSYTNIGLTIHTDNTYFTEAAGLQIFHLLSHNGNGGETLLVDGFKVANILKTQHPQEFKILCEYSVRSKYIEDGYHFSTTESVIKLDPVTGDFLQIRYNIFDRDTFDTIPQDKIVPFYKAYQLFGKIATDPNNVLKLKLPRGYVVIIDNWRVMHGRTAYDGLRNLCGCYISRSDWTSKAKSLDVNVA